MIAIEGMSMPSCCASCPFDVLSKCLFTRQVIKGGCLVNGEDKRLDGCPLVEIEERKHGKWEHDKLFGECAYVCSFCHTIWTSSEIQNMHYCPTCGADMRGSENGN